MMERETEKAWNRGRDAGRDKDKGGGYEDIIGLPHHVSTMHPHMSAMDRAAQFSPFAALTGHEAAIRETARLTDRRVELDENSRELLDERMQMLREQPEHGSEVSITYFVQDARKTGGTYRTVTGHIRRLDEQKQEICMEDGTVIPMKEIGEVDGAVFRML